MVILRKGDSAKASSALFRTLLHFAQLVIYAFIGYYLPSINVLVCLDDFKFAYTPCYSL